MYKFGLKLFSTNHFYINEAIDLYEKKIYSYIELYSFPNSYNKFINFWQDIKTPFIIHAPHFSHGVNLADKKNEKTNLTLLKEAIKYADILNSDKIIVHPGVEGDIKETLRQLNILDDERIIIENKPFYSLDKKYICNGAVYDEIKYLFENSNYGFCLDIGHAICSANAQQINPLEYIKKLLNFNPVLYHLTDGEYKSEIDFHYHYGKGNFPIKEIIDIIPKNCIITNEAKKDSLDNLNDFIDDMNYLKKIISI